MAISTKSAQSAPVRPARFLALFAICFLAGFALILAPPAERVVAWFSRALVAAAGMLIHVCGGSALIAGDILRDPASGAAIQMKDGCNGIYVTLLLYSALLAFPASWNQRTKGVLLGGVAIQALNLLRFISLFYLQRFNQAWFDFAHNYLWESLIMLDALAVFWMWAQQSLRTAAGARVPHARP